MSMYMNELAKALKSGHTETNKTKNQIWPFAVAWGQAVSGPTPQQLKCCCYPLRMYPVMDCILGWGNSMTN